MKPAEDFKALLSEYLQWTKDHRGGGFEAALSTALQGESAEDGPTWEIRKGIHDAALGTPPAAEPPFLKWHMILHLAREIEQSQMDAHEMLGRLESEKAPLDEAIEEPSPEQGLLNGIASLGALPFLESRHYENMLEAWFGLFGEGIPSQGVLVTRYSDVRDLARDRSPHFPAMRHLGGPVVLSEEYEHPH